MPSERAPKWVHPRDLHDEPRGDMVAVEVKRGRSVAMNGLYWAALGEVVASGATKYPSAEHMHDAIKMELGYFTPMVRLNGEIVLVPDSTAFERMRQADFNAFFERARLLVLEHYGVDIAQLRRAA